MREIKFRAWDKHQKKMTPGVEWLRPLWGLLDLQRFAEDHYPSIPKGEDRWILMQFTGLKDKNGKDIYEGDILEVTDSGAPAYKTPMEWSGNGWWLNDARGGRYLPNSEYMEVIGNIYENPELLK